MPKELLQQIGLTEKEAEIYLLLLGSGSTPVNRLYEKTGIHRRNIYDLLNKLIDKGLATYIVENKKKYFQAQNPKALFKYLDERREKIERQKENLFQYVKQLEARFNTTKAEQEAEIYRGIEGIKTILLDCLGAQEVYFIGATGFVGEKLPYFWPQYDKKRIQNKVRWKLLLNYEAKNKPITKSKYREFKVLPKELSGPNVIYIYEDKIANVLWADPPISFVIHDKQIAENYKRYFHYLWKII